MRRALPAAVLLAASAAVAQPPQNLYPQPRIQSAFPAGAKAGSTVEVTVRGTDLDDPTGLAFGHPGITAEYVPPPDPPELPKDAKAKGAPPAKRKKAAPPPTEAKFKVTVADDVPPGSYDVRAVGRFGVSNPRAFVVGTAAEVSEKEPNDDVDKAQRVAIGTTVNGVLGSPTDVDYTAFTGTAGQRVLIHCATSSIDSKARPWVEVYAGDGRTRLADNRNYQDGDALADVTLPDDGNYYVRVTEFAHQSGDPDHFYRLTITAGPWVDAVFPPAVEPGKPARLTVYGRNLPGGKPTGRAVDGRPVESINVTVTPPADAAGFTFRGRVPPAVGLQDAFEYRLAGANGVPVFLAANRVVLEKEGGNDRPEGAEEVPVPCEVAGRIDRRGDRDWFAFPAKKGDVLTIELRADRLGTGQDLALAVRAAGAKQDIVSEGSLDDDNDSLHPTAFFTRTTDPPAYRFTAPADGKYLVRVSVQSGVESGPRCAYRLRIAPPRPDFRAVVMPRSRDLPAAVIARPDGEVAFDVFVNRTDGFAGPLTATAEGLPAGVTARPVSIGPGLRWGTLVLTGAAGLADAVTDLRVKVAGVIDGKPVVREARPASVTWGLAGGPPNVPTVARLDQALVLATRAEKAPFRLVADTAKSPFVLRPGQKLTLPVKVIWQDAEARAQPLQLQAEAIHPNMQQAPVTVNNGQPIPVPKEKTEVPVTIDVRANALPGTYSVVLRGETPVKVAKDAAGKDKKDVTAAAYTAPIEVTVIPASLAKLSAQAPTAVKPGAAADVLVKVERQADFAGEFRVSLVLPKDVGLTANEVTIPPGTAEAKLTVTVAPGAKPGAAINAVVQAVALYDGKYETKHEAKITLNIAK